MTDLFGTQTLLIFFLATLAILGLLVAVLWKTRQKPPSNINKSEIKPDIVILDNVKQTDETTQTETKLKTTSSQLDIPEPVAGRLFKLRKKLAQSESVFGKGLLALLSREKIEQDIWDEIEETLLLADLGAQATTQLLEALQKRVKIEATADPKQVKKFLREELINLVDPTLDREIKLQKQNDKPAVILVVGVNGVGKTTTVGKFARILVAENKTVILGAADTFRAAAAQQLATWGARVGVETVQGATSGIDPASVAFDAVQKGISKNIDVVLVDTAGRLQNKVGLMDELGKIKRVIEKHCTISEILLVLDATTGQNGLQQAKVFAEAVNISGIVLTKLDGSAKGGIVVAIQQNLGVPVKFIGLGEGADDLAVFVVEEFVDALLGD